MGERAMSKRQARIGYCEHRHRSDLCTHRAVTVPTHWIDGTILCATQPVVTLRRADSPGPAHPSAKSEIKQQVHTATLLC